MSPHMSVFESPRLFSLCLWVHSSVARSALHTAVRPARHRVPSTTWDACGRSSHQDDIVVLWVAAQVLVEGGMPEFLHQVPICNLTRACSEAVLLKNKHSKKATSSTVASLFTNCSGILKSCWSCLVLSHLAVGDRIVRCVRMHDRWIIRLSIDACKNVFR